MDNFTLTIGTNLKILFTVYNLQNPLWIGEKV